MKLILMLNLSMRIMMLIQLNLDIHTPISASDITAKQAELKTTWDTKAYAREKRFTDQQVMVLNLICYGMI